MEMPVGPTRPQPFGQMPELHEQPGLHMPEVRDRVVQRERLRAADRAAGEAREHLGPPRRPAEERRIEDRHPARREHRPGDLGRHGQRVLAVDVPRPQQVALAEQLGRRRAEQLHIPQQEPLDDKQPQMPLAVGWSPAAALPIPVDRRHRCDELRGGCLQRRRIEVGAKVRIDVQKSHAASRYPVPRRARSGHAQLPADR